MFIQYLTEFKNKEGDIEVEAQQGEKRNTKLMKHITMVACK